MSMITAQLKYKNVPSTNGREDSKSSELFTTQSLYTLEHIFNNCIFRIPDYQRGYSWKIEELDDIWEDIKNLQPTKHHYTGIITVEPLQLSQVKKWKEEAWLLNKSNFKPYYIVDGQQRLTTIIILLNNLIGYLTKDEKYLGYTKSEITEKYLYKKHSNNNQVCYMFGYEVDDPSYEYLKRKIFKQDSFKGSPTETSYTNNLYDCNRFFDKKLLSLSHEQREELFRKLTQQLKFDVKVIASELDIFVVFETMNNRGKELTNLEKLKNRLIYLSTLMPGVSEKDADHLRNDINDVWKTIYSFLGRDKKNTLPDDIFLRNHFILYHFYNKEKGFPFHQIFKEIYTVQNTVEKTTECQYKSIRAYISSLRKASEQWYIINNPEHAYTNNLLVSEEERDCLIKINRLGLRIFGPLALSVYLTTDSESKRIKFLNKVEAFIFLIYLCAGKKSSLGTAEFSNIANYLFNKKNDYDIDKVIAQVNYWTYGDDEDEGNYSNEKFILNIKDQFLTSKGKGYYEWAGLRYLLFEYDEFVRKGYKEASKVKWDMPNSIEHVYPQTPLDASWKKAFTGFSEKQRRFLVNSLGNLVLLSHSKNSTLSNKSFKEKVLIEYSSGNKGGYKFGSHSEIDIAHYFKKWDARSIYQRGLRILEFLNKNWCINLSRKQMKELLLIDPLLMKKIR